MKIVFFGNADFGSNTLIDLIKSKHQVVAIVTNKDVLFNQWGWDAKLVEEHMKVGECWYIDVRKPHRAINGGIEMRTHLVVDIEANEKVRALIC